MAFSKKNKTAPVLGQTVVYISTKGYRKVAIVTAVPETVEPGHALPVLEEGQLHLAVINAQTGTMSARHSVPNAALFEDEPRGAWALI